jgi:endonuclease III
MSVVDELLRQYGRTYAEDAGIRLAERPGPLYRLLVASTVLSARISADIAVAAARELSAAGCSSPRGMLDASWQDRVDALGRAHYRRYDERTATMLGDGAGLLLTKYRGDLRRLRDAAGGDAGRIADLLMEFPGIGPSGASIFLREVQETWPSVCPYVDTRMLEGARRVGLPDDRDALVPVVAGSSHPARLAAALVRVSLSHSAAGEITSAARQ